jgi:hypothetical protein
MTHRQYDFVRKKYYYMWLVAIAVAGIAVLMMAQQFFRSGV